MKKVDVTNTKDALKKDSAIKIFGNPDLWVLICKASSQPAGWYNSTKAMQTESGCLVLVSSEKGDTLTFCPNAKIKEDENGNKYLN